MQRPPADHIRRFMAAIRSGQRDIGDTARAAGLAFHEAAEVYAYGTKKGALSFHDGGPGNRWIEEKKR